MPPDNDLAAWFGRGRRRMPGGDHVEVVREDVRPGERQRWSKRFLLTTSGDYRPWTAREADVLARLAEQRVAQVVRRAGFDPGSAERPAELQTFDAGLTVDQWATLLAARSGGATVDHVFEDCAHWWALAHHSLLALDAVHARGLVHLDLKADNLCVPWRPAAGASSEPSAPKVLRFAELALIDFAFCAIHGEASPRPLPLLHETEQEYQSPRLVEALEAGRRGDPGPMRALDWRCDLFSLAAMLWLYLPEPDEPGGRGWPDERRGQATVLVRRLIDEHDAALPAQRPHAELIGLTASALADEGLNAALSGGWTFAARSSDAALPWSAPMTRVAAVEAGHEVAFAPGASREPVAEPERAIKPFPAEPDPVRVESGPLHVDPEPMHVDPEPMHVGAGALHDEPEPIRVEREPIYLEPESMRIESRSTPVELEANSVGAGANPVEQEASDLETGLIAVGSEPIQVGPAPWRIDSEIPVEHEPILGAPPDPYPPPPPPPPPRSPEPLPVDRGRRYGAAAIVGILLLVAAWVVQQRSDRTEDAPLARGPQTSTSSASAPDPAPVVAVAPQPTPIVEAAPASGAVVAAAPASSGVVAAAPASASVIAAAPPPASVVEAAPATVPPALDERTAAILGLSPRPAPSIPRAPAAAAVREPSISEPAPAARATDPTRTADATRAGDPTQTAESARAADSTRAADANTGVAPGSLLTKQIPQMALWADQRLSPVLEMAESPNALPARDKVRAAVAAARLAPGRPTLAIAPDASEARRLNEAARAAYWNRDDPREALRLEQQAFAANPLDAEVAGNLAFYRMRQQPPQVESARQLSLHSLALPDARYPSGRTEDWINLAITSALLGRETDARRAWAIALVVTTDVERVRGAGIKAQALYGDRLRASVQAMLWRSRLAA